MARFRSTLLGVLIGTCLAMNGIPVYLDGEGEPLAAGRNRILDAFQVLDEVPSGKDILDRAAKRFDAPDRNSLLKVFKWGTVSRTDAILTRHYNPKTGAEVRERKVQVILREGEGLDDLVLDVAHELTHAISSPDWDPYDPALTPARYIQATIEGEGGEVDAVSTECRVSLELAQRFGTSAHRCGRYRAGTAGIERAKVMKDFYRVGRWQREISQKLGGDAETFPLLSGEAPMLYSSTGNAPYPISLIREYEEITQIACDNSKKRLDLLSPTRAPASSPESGQAVIQQTVAKFLASRCQP